MRGSKVKPPKVTITRTTRTSKGTRGALETKTGITTKPKRGSGRGANA